MDMIEIDKILRISEDSDSDSKSLVKAAESLKSLPSKNPIALSSNLDELGLTAKDLTTTSLRELIFWISDLAKDVEESEEDDDSKKDETEEKEEAEEESKVAAKSSKKDLNQDLLRMKNNSKLNQPAKKYVKPSELNNSKTTVSDLVDALADAVAGPDEEEAPKKEVSQEQKVASAGEEQGEMMETLKALMQKKQALNVVKDRPAKTFLGIQSLSDISVGQLIKMISDKINKTEQEDQK
jgi:hypothetical protein